MNAVSLAYSNTQMQQKEKSWNDDPFDLRGFVTGVTKVSNHASNFNNYVQELVYNYGKNVGDNYELNIDKLSSPCQFELTRLYIESIDREIEWACYGEDESINSSFLCAMLSMLSDSNPKTRDNFARVTTLNIFKYYKDVLQNVLNDACEEYFCNQMHEAGYRQERDMNHGDLIYKF